MKSTYLAPIEVAKKLGISVDYVYRLLWMKKLPGKKVAGKWLVLEQAVEERLACRT